jgi:hypothetical protein
MNNTKSNKEIVTNDSSNSIETFISQAISSNVPIETLEKLLAMRKEFILEQSKTAFIEALSNFQKNCPNIEKTKVVKNKDGQSVRYKYAPLDEIVSKVKDVLANNGLSYTWEVKNEPDFITVIAIITHNKGYSQNSEFKVPVDKNDYMTSPQRYASALTFAKRYSLCNALGIATTEEDTDATDVKKENNVKSDKSKIVFLLKTIGCDTETKTKIENSVKELTQLDLSEQNYKEIVNRLEILVQENNTDKEIK